MTAKAIEMEGQTFGALTVVERAGLSGGSNAAWRCVCECGGEAVVRGSILRKGDRRSCGCRNQNGHTAEGRTVSKAKSRQTTGADRWRAVEIDDLVFLVRDIAGREVLVEFTDGGWACSECGSFPLAAARTGITTCQHVMGATRSMPLAIARQIATIIAPTKPVPVPGPSGRGIGPAEVERAIAESLARGADARRERASRHDSTHRQVTSEVTVRRMTPEDHARLAERRRHRRIGA